MSGDPATATAEHESDADAGRSVGLASWAGAARAVSELDRERVVLGAGLAALAAVATRTLLLVLYNLPFDPLVVSPSVRTAVSGTTSVVLALALVAVALATRRPAARVGLLSAGVFGLLATLDAAATLPAVVSLTAGGGLAVLGTAGWPSSYRDARRRAVAVLLVAGVALSMASTVGLLAGTTDVGGLLALVGVAGVGVRAEGDRVALLAGVAAFAAVALASLASPFVVGSALLVGFAVVGVPHLLVALAAGGATAATVAGLSRGEYALAVGAGLLVLAGVPGTVPRALAVVLGVTLAIVGVEGLASRPADGTGEVAP